MGRVFDFSRVGFQVKNNPQKNFRLGQVSQKHPRAGSNFGSGFDKCIFLLLNHHYVQCTLYSFLQRFGLLGSSRILPRVGSDPRKNCSGCRVGLAKTPLGRVLT